jgi:hypothetical protein
LKTQDFTAKPQAIAGELTNFQQRVVYEPRGGVALDCVLDGFSGPVEPDVSRVKDGLIGGLPERIRCFQLLDDDPVERPAMRGRNLLEFRARLRKGDIDDRLTCIRSRQKELQAKGRLAGAGGALGKVEARPWKTASEDPI